MWSCKNMSLWLSHLWFMRLDIKGSKTLPMYSQVLKYCLASWLGVYMYTAIYNQIKNPKSFLLSCLQTSKILDVDLGLFQMIYKNWCLCNGKRRSSVKLRLSRWRSQFSMVFVVISLFLSILLVGWTCTPLKMNNEETMPTKVFEVSKCQILRCWAGQFLGQERSRENYHIHCDLCQAAQRQQRCAVQVIMKPLLLLPSGQQCPNYFRLIRTQKCTPSFIRIAAFV